MSPTIPAILDVIITPLISNLFPIPAPDATEKTQNVVSFIEESSVIFFALFTHRANVVTHTL